MSCKIHPLTALERFIYLITELRSFKKQLISIVFCMQTLVLKLIIIVVSASMLRSCLAGKSWFIVWMLKDTQTFKLAH